MRDNLSYRRFTVTNPVNAMTTKHTHLPGDEQKFWDDCFLIAFDECLKQLGQRKAPACVDDSAELASLAIASRRKAQGKQS